MSELDEKDIERQARELSRGFWERREHLQKEISKEIITEETYVAGFKAGFIRAHFNNAEQIRDYEAALEFYAMRQEYAQRIEKPARRGGCPIITYPIGLRSDGRIARETLAKWKR